MFVKAGIVVSAAAATLLAVSPLAFAGDYDHDNHKSHHKSSKDKDDDDSDHKRHRGHRDDNDGDCNGDVNQSNDGDSGGLINISHVNAAVPICDVDILSGVLGILSNDLTNVDAD